MFDHEPIFGKNVIETLSEGMYDNPLFLFREYIQNAADSIDAAVRSEVLSDGEGQIEVWIDKEKRNITFEDNGLGIQKTEVKKMLANIGDSQKDRKTDKGFRGIGRLGGLAYCKKVVFETSAKRELVKTIFEWDAELLHKILSDKEEKIDAGQLIKRITSTREEKCDAEKHFFKISLLGINQPNDALLDLVEVRRYLQMVAPVPFDYTKFPLVEKIEKFIEKEHLSPLHEYRLNLNGDEIRKGYETPLAIGDGKTVDILDIECRTIKSGDKLIGWYWYCISKFEGVLPPKCWQRSIRLRKSNIQIGEADCLSNQKHGQMLWREDRGNNYFIGEIHAIDEELIPNSRRDYFNPNPATARFEEALKKEFQNLHQLYHEASEIRSAYSALHAADKAQTEFEIKDKQGGFFENQDRDNASRKVEDARKKAEDAKRKIEKLEEKLTLQKEEQDPFAVVFSSYSKNKKTLPPFNPREVPLKGYAKDAIKKPVREVLDIVFEVLYKMLPDDEAALIKDEIVKRFH